MLFRKAFDDLLLVFKYTSLKVIGNPYVHDFVIPVS